MWDLPNLGGLHGISAPENVSHTGPFDHGLGRDNERQRLAIFNAHTSFGLNPRSIAFGITQMMPVSIDTDNPQASIANALDLLQRHVSSWHDRVSYHELGSSLQLLPDETMTDNDEASETASAKSADKRFVMHPHHYGYLRLHSVFSKAFDRIREDAPDDETLKAADIAQRALKDLLPEQAYLFIPPDALMLATKEAERIAEDTIKHTKQREKEQPKEAKLYGQVKHKLASSIHAMRVRHDARMHIFPYTQLYAPETGIATIAIIASQQQSIANDHGRVSASARGLVF